jgi:hypothetical protein
MGRPELMRNPYRTTSCPGSRLLGDEVGPPSPAVAGLGSACPNGFPSAPRKTIYQVVGRKGCSQQLSVNAARLIWPMLVPARCKLLGMLRVQRLDQINRK